MLPPAQGSFDISLPDNLGRRTGGVRQVHDREREDLLLTDTTQCYAHQYLLVIRMRTQELGNAAKSTNLDLRNLFYLDMWGGATFDIAIHFVFEFPWELLKTLREKLMDVPFQMLLCGANSTG